MLPAVSAKSLDSFNEALQHHPPTWYMMYYSGREPCSTTGKSGTPLCRLGVPCIPARTEIAKCTRIGCPADTDARSRSKFHVAGVITELAALRWPSRVHFIRLEGCDVLWFQAFNSGSHARLILQGQRQAHNTAEEAGMSLTSTVQRLSESHASASGPIPASLPVASLPNVLL